MAAVEVQPWERQPGEPEEPWRAFQAYRDQVPPRGLGRIYLKEGSSVRLQWFNEWRWQERAVSFDRHTDAIRVAEREEVLKQNEKERTARQLGQIKAVQDIIDRELAKLARDTEKTEAFGLVKVSELNKLLANAITLERLIHGESTQNVDVDVNLDNLSPEELRQLRDLQKKMAGDQ
jgi:hypothetical protein